MTARELFFKMILSLGLAEAALASTCPYLKKSEDAQALMQDASESVQRAIDNLRKNAQDCKIDENSTLLISSYQTAIEKLKEAKFPNEKNLGDDLRVAGEPFVCSPDRSELYQFLSDYTRDRISQIKSGSSSRAAVSGELGEALEVSIESCSRLHNDQNDVQKCVYQELRFDPARSENPGSLVDTIYRKNCFGDASTRTAEDYRKRAKELNERRAAFEGAMSTISTASNQLSTMITNAGENTPACKMLKTSMNSALFTGMNFASMISGPWGSMGAAVMAPLVQAAVQAVGLQTEKAKDLMRLKSQLQGNESDALMERFSCNLYQANRLNCEFLRRSANRAKSQGVCEKPVEKGLREIVELSRTWGENREQLNLASADQLKKDFFDPELRKADGAFISRYEYLFGARGFFAELQEKLQPSKSLVDKNFSEELQKFRRDLDGFRDEYAKTLYGGASRLNSPSFERGMEVVRFIQGGSYSEALIRAIEMREVESGANAVDGLNSVLAKDLRNQLLNQAINLSSAVPEDRDETASLTGRLGDLYDSFLGPDSRIRKGFLLEPAVARIGRLKKRFLEGMPFDDSGKLMSRPANFSSYLYPMLRDCLMNYQAGVIPGGEDGAGKLEPSYQEACGFLRKCEAPDNRIALPFELSSPSQGNYKSSSAESFKACSLVTQFDAIAERVRQEVETKSTICGEPISELIK